MSKTEIVVVGAGIAVLTSAAILSKLGLSVTLIGSHTQSGGCAGTFKRKRYIFDVGATQVAGLEEGGIHSKIFKFLDIPRYIKLMLSKKMILDGLITHEFKLEKINDALNLFRTGGSGRIIIQAP